MGTEELGEVYRKRNTAIMSHVDVASIMQVHLPVWSTPESTLAVLKHSTSNAVSDEMPHPLRSQLVRARMPKGVCTANVLDLG